MFVNEQTGLCMVLKFVSAITQNHFMKTYCLLRTYKFTVGVFSCSKKIIKHTVFVDFFVAIGPVATPP